MSVFNRGTNIIIQADPSFSVIQAIDAADRAIAAASGITTPYDTRDAFLAAQIAPVVTRARFYVNGETCAVVRDGSGPIVQNNGQTWRPDGDVTPQHFGAVGDAVANDTASVQAAITYAASAGMSVKVTRQHLTGALTVSASLICDNQVGGFTRLLASTGNWFGVAANDVEMSGLRILGQDVLARCIEVESHSGVKVTNNYVRGVGEFFVHFNGANNLVVEGNDCANGRSGVSNVMPVDVVGFQSNYVSIVGNKFDNLTATAVNLSGNQTTGDPNNGLVAPLVRYSVVSGNTISNTAGNGLLIQAWDISVTGNVVTDTGDIGGNQAIVCQGRFITVSGNTVKRGNGVGIDMGACFHSTVTGNVVDEFAQIGIEVQSCVNTTVTGNTVFSCGHGITGENSAGIVVAEGFFGAGYATENIVVTGNTVRGGALNGEYGISVRAGVDAVIVTANVLVGAGSIGRKFIDGSANVYYAGNIEEIAQSEHFTIYGDAPQLKSTGPGGNADLILLSQGTGRIRFGSHTASADVPVTGYIEIKDIGGTIRRLAVVG